MVAKIVSPRRHRGRAVTAAVGLHPIHQDLAAPDRRMRMQTPSGEQEPEPEVVNGGFIVAPSGTSWHVMK